MSVFRTNGACKPKIDTGDHMITEQHHKDSCDIHHIMRKYEQTGICDHIARVQGQYADYLGAPDFQEAQNAIAESKSMFESLPAKLRAEFDNQPGTFVDFMTNPANIAAIEELGLNADHLKPDRDTVITREPQDPANAPDQPPTPAEDCD